MKTAKITVLSTVLVLMTGMFMEMHAQSPVKFGLKGGLNIANFTGTDYESDARFGLTVGAVVDLSLPAVPFGIETGLAYTQKGAEQTDQGVTGTLKVDYLELPVLAKFQLGPSGPATPHLVIGPYIGFNVNAEAELSGDGGSFSGDISDQTNGTEIGGIAGVGVDFNLGVTRLSARAQYGYGFTNVFKDDFDDGERNAALSATVGIWF